MAKPSVKQVFARLKWHRQQVGELDIQLAGLHTRRLTPVRRRLKEHRTEHLRTIKLLEKLIC